MVVLLRVFRACVLSRYSAGSSDSAFVMNPAFLEQLTVVSLQTELQAIASIEAEHSKDIL
jgi:hypothetical protein